MIKDQLNIKENLIYKVLENDEAFLKALYKEWRVEFKSWFERKYQLNDAESSEIYQDTFLQLFINIREEKVTEIEHPKTYLYGIGKNLMRQRYKKEGKEMLLSEGIDLIDQEDFDFHRERSEQSSEIMQLLNHFGDPCRTLLLMFYFEKFSHEVIAERMGYKNEQVVKKKKSLCMSDLRRLWTDYRKKMQMI